ncbi:MAG TPA: glucose-6-phosphate dehydrogenase [Methylocystis sp.]|nr:glucose-6-phosphate dehydrogenase [Methylocystis sp.]
MAKILEADCQPCPQQQSRIQPEPCVMVIFGAEGDLTKRLLTPALYNLARTNALPEDFGLIGVSRGEQTSQAWRDKLHATLESFVAARAEFSARAIDEQAWARLSEKMTYLRGDVTMPDTYERLTTELEKQRERNVIFYLAVADRFFETIVEELGAAGLTREHPHGDGAAPFWRRVVIEKPFGHDLESAKQLNARILQVLREDQIFRIDHYLGKDTVQSIMALRFANGFFEPIWNRDRIDHVQITVAETVGVEGRGNFYEATGALRDMVPNHVFSLVSMIAMEPPIGFDAAAIRAKKAEVFMAMPPMDPQRAVRGQYGAGVVLNQPKSAYREEPKVSATSNVETYAAMRLEIDNWRWAGVPFYIRTGKHMSQRSTEVAICFKQAPATTFQRTPVECLKPNWLVLGIAPKEAISLQFEVKRPGAVVNLCAVRMDFNYEDWFPKEPNVGYETLIYDVMIGDQTLFMRADMVEEAWRVVQPVLDAWARSGADFPDYPSGGDGPAGADELLKRDGRSWRPVAARAEAAR